MTESFVFWILVALAVGAFIPKLIVRSGNKIPDFLNPCTGAKPAQESAASPLSQGADPAPAYAATAASRRPLAECYDWFVRAGAGLIEPTAGDLRLAKAIKPHLDNLVGGKVSSPSLSDLEPK